MQDDDGIKTKTTKRHNHHAEANAIIEQVNKVASCQ
jgi:hypothetical protein